MIQIVSIQKNSPDWVDSSLQAVSAQESILQTTDKSQEGNAGRRKESESARNSRTLFETNRNWKLQFLLSVEI